MAIWGTHVGSRHGCSLFDRIYGFGKPRVLFSSFFPHSIVAQKALPLSLPLLTCGNSLSLSPPIPTNLHLSPSCKEKSLLLVLIVLFSSVFLSDLVRRLRLPTPQPSMSLEALAASNDLPNFLIYDTISAPPANLLFENASLFGFFGDRNGIISSAAGDFTPQASADVKPAQPRRKRRRRPRSCKNKEEAESQRMTHIAVERNRRRQMNEHLAVLRSLMPESYVQRGDQASIVGGAIDFVKELEQLLQSLEAQKRTVMQDKAKSVAADSKSRSTDDSTTELELLPPFAQFFSYPQYIWCHAPRDYPPPPEIHRAPSLADIEVTLIETHANLRILSPRRPRQLLKLVAGLQALRLTILHLNVTSLDFMVLYSLSTKVEEGCSLTTVEDIAAAVHHMLSLIEAETPAHSQ